MNTGLIFLAIGIVILIITAKIRLNTLAFLAKAISTKGRVINLEERASNDDDGRYSYSYYPVVEFSYSRGRTKQFVSKLGRNPPAFKVGQEVTVMYDPNNVESAKIGTFGELWLFTVILGSLSCYSSKLDIWAGKMPTPQYLN